MFEKLIEMRSHSGAIYAGDFNAGFLYTGSVDKYVTRWKLNGEQDHFAIKLLSPVYSLKVCGQNLWVGLNTGDVHVFDLVKRKEIKHFTIHKTPIFNISYQAQNAFVFCSDATGNLSVWDNNSLELKISLPLNCEKIRHISFNDQNSIILSCGDGNIRMIDLDTFNETNSFQAHQGGTYSTLPLKGNTLLSAGKDAHLRLWNMESSNLIKAFPAHNFGIYDLIQMNDDCEIVSCSLDKTIKVWSADDLSIVERIDRSKGGHSHSVNKLIRINENTFASLSDDRRIIIWKKGD